MKLTPDTTYLVESAEDDTVLLAIDARITEHGAEWFDTSRDRCVEVEALDERDGSVVVKSSHASYAFFPLTLELYNAKVVAKVAGSRAFGSTEELLAFYRDFPR